MESRLTLKNCFTIFVYLSIAFLIVYLYKYDFLDIDLQEIDGYYLAVSIPFLLGGFVISVVCWYYYCRRLSGDIALNDAFISYGLSVFGKYIPGKVWAILGMAAYLSSAGISFKATSQLSLYTQLLSIWSGLTLGVVGLAVIDSLSPILWMLVPVWLLAGIGLFVPVLGRGPRSGSLGRLFDRVNVIRDFATPGYVARTLPLFFAFWLSWTVGFYFLGRAIVPAGALDWQVMFAFPFAATIGILALVFPGGLGVREGLLVYYMVQAGVPVAAATLTSIVARIWFLVGEVFIFVLALGLRIGVRKG